MPSYPQGYTYLIHDLYMGYPQGYPQLINSFMHMIPTGLCTYVLYKTLTWGQTVHKYLVIHRLTKTVHENAHEWCIFTTMVHA